MNTNQLKQTAIGGVAFVITLITIMLLLSSCATTESLLRCSGHDRMIIGYTNNKRFYKVLDDCGHKQPPVRILTQDTLKPGDYLIKRQEFRVVADLD